MSQIIPIYIPTLISDINYNPAKVYPRLFFYNGKVECEPYYFERKTTSGSAIVTNVQLDFFPYVDHYSVVTGSFPTDNSKSLLFQNENPVYGAIPTGSLYTEYWETYINLLYNPLTRLINCKGIIPLADYYKMELNDVVEWRGNSYHLRAINNYDLKEGTCDIQLLGPIIRDTFGSQVIDCTFDFETNRYPATTTTTLVPTTTIAPTTTTLAPTTSTTTLVPTTTTTLAPTTTLSPTTTIAPTTTDACQLPYSYTSGMVGWSPTSAGDACTRDSGFNFKADSDVFCNITEICGFELSFIGYTNFWISDGTNSRQVTKTGLTTADVVTECVACSFPTTTLPPTTTLAPTTTTTTYMPISGSVIVELTLNSPEFSVQQVAAGWTPNGGTTDIFPVTQSYSPGISGSYFLTGSAALTDVQPLVQIYATGSNCVSQSIQWKTSVYSSSVLLYNNVSSFRFDEASPPLCLPREYYIGFNFPVVDKIIYTINVYTGSIAPE